MTAEEARRERAGLEAVAPTIRANAGELNARLNAHRAEVARLEQRRVALARQWATEGGSISIDKELNAIDRRLAKAPAAEARIAALLEAGGEAMRDATDARSRLLQDELVTYRADAVKLSERVETLRRALGPAIQELVAAEQAAALEWGALRGALIARLRERDLAAGIDRAADAYVRATEMPRPLLSPAALVRPYRPEAEELFKHVPAPQFMRRIA